ncbi:MAG: VWA domain-containing protein [Candidatus Accumulibacter sp.]|nr:VWA domain-containing protein [Accumulibacter sp.]
MTTLAKGQRLKISDLIPTGAFRVGLAAHGLAVDFACFGLDSAGKLSDDRYMTFFNQPRSPCGGLEVCTVPGDPDGFAFKLASLPTTVDRVVVALSVSGDGVMSALGSGYLRIVEGERELAHFPFTGADFSSERALILGEFYRKDGGWRFMAVGQGFDGGLEALVKHFGATVEESLTPPAAQAAKVALNKRVEREAPQLVNLIKQAGVSLQKVGLSDHHAKVCLCLDISGSMAGLYRQGMVQSFAERVLALGCKFDDDGAIDVFLFGEEVHQPVPMGLANCRGYVQQLVARHPLEGDTRYGRAMAAIRGFYFPDTAGGERLSPVKAALPVYVMFVTDGSTSDKAVTEKQLRWSGMEPIFWQFMGIGKGRKPKSRLLAAFSTADFPFLESLDDLPGRFIDNADYFSVSSLDEHSDAALYDLLMTEYPGWLKLASRHGLLP